MRLWFSTLLFVSIIFSRTTSEFDKEDFEFTEDEDDDYFLNGLSENETNITTGTTEPPPSMSPFLINITLPVCEDGEFLSFGGTDLNCVSIPERRCRCPRPTDMVATKPPLSFHPPEGCTVFEPPVGGAFVCLLFEEVQIYCSVLCNDRFEFSNFPLNPYSCGILSTLQWMDSTNLTRTVLPDCSGIRTSPQTLHQGRNYFTGPCDELSTEMVAMEFCNNLGLFASNIVCDSDRVLIHCGTDD